MSNMIEYEKLKNIASYPTGKLNSNAADENGKYPFFTCAHEIYKINSYSYDGEYVLLGGNNANGDFPVFYFNGKFDAYQRTYLISSKNPNYETKYLYYAIQLKLKQMQKNASGTATKYLTLPILNSINIEKFDYDDQLKLINILEKYDLLIENNNKRIKILEQMAEELYKEWFVRFRYPGYEKYKRKDGIPGDWKVSKIGDVCEVIGGGTPSTKIDEYWDGDIPWITPADLAKHEIPRVFKGERNITDLAINKSGAKLLKKNTIILSSRAPIGYVAISSTEMCTNQGCKNLECDDNLINYYYLFMWLKNNKDLLNSYGSGATFLELSIKSLSKIKLLLPSIKLQNQFGGCFEKIDAEITNLALQNENLINQRDLLLPRLMSGKLEIE